MDEGLLIFISVGCGQFVKMLIILEPHGIFDYLYFFNWQGKRQRKEKTRNDVHETLCPNPLLVHKDDTLIRQGSSYW